MWNGDNGDGNGGGDEFRAGAGDDESSFPDTRSPSRLATPTLSPLLPMDAAGASTVTSMALVAQAAQREGGRGTCRGHNKSKTQSDPRRTWVAMDSVQVSTYISTSNVPCAAEPPHGLLIAS